MPTRSRSATDRHIMKTYSALTIIPRIFGTFICLVFIGVGGIFLKEGLSVQQREASARNWQEVPCTVLKSDVQDVGNGRYEFSVYYEYEVGGRAYRSQNYHVTKETYRFDDVSERRPLLDRYAKGAKATCLVNPDAPDKAALVPRPFSAVTLFPAIFCILGLLILCGIWSTAETSRAGRRKNKATGVPAVFAPVIFGSAFFVMGSLFASFGIREFCTTLGAKDWPVVTGTVLRSEVVATRGSKGSTHYRQYVAYSYTIDGVSYEGDRYARGGAPGGARRSREIVAEHPVGSPIEVHVHPTDPTRSIVNTDIGIGPLVALLFPLLFAVVGAAIALSSLRTLAKKRRMAGVATGTTMESLRASAPAMPTGPLRRKSRSEAIALLAFAVLWCGFMGFMTRMALYENRHGRGFAIDRWMPVVICGILDAIGLGLLVKAVRGLVCEAVCPHLVVERMGGAVAPGMAAQMVYRLDAGSEKIESLRMEFIGYMVETHDTGKGQTTVRVPFLEQEVHRAMTPFEISRGSFQASVEPDAVPPDAEGEGPHWELVAHLRLKSGRAYADKYEIG